MSTLIKCVSRDPDTNHITELAYEDDDGETVTESRVRMALRIEHVDAAFATPDGEPIEAFHHEGDWFVKAASEPAMPGATLLEVDPC